MQDNLDDLVVLLLRQRHRTDAVRLYQDEMQINPLEAKQAVDGIARRNGIPTRHIQHMVWLALMLIAALAYAGAVLAR
jgi:N-glycosylase/DNA lyase